MLSHPWNLTPVEAIALQQQLRSRVVCDDRLAEIRSVAGVDVGFEQGGQITRAAVAVLSFPSLKPVEQAIACLPTTFPYVPGLLSFREVPAILQAIAQLRRRPDILLCDGQGLAHPRRFGIACHLGVLSDIPSIGVAKTRLIGSHADPPEEKGGWRPLFDKDEIIGAVLRTRSGVKPLYISVGHRVSLQTAIDLVMACTTRYKLPETTRAAHRLASG
ncbi:MAG: deoxyribonuclease V [Candidatus Thiodiazotropha sp. (ex Dulcina madagascariensis)]|nr:deoxyribonuclease V [Candidatus Thiodiazotropha sp. (ex Dulcina madagascariensis)]MCU7925728.1 deoxyribonuclease V [Candidatus Thiodiazotropha sp. (ex Dulcina madagascariensis)]